MPVRRSIPICILLTIVTCGIYGLYWFVMITDEMNASTGGDGTSGIMAVLFNIITCGIYGYFWAYKMGIRAIEFRQSRGLTSEEYIPILYLVLAIFGLQIVVYALVQDTLNQGSV